MERIGASHDGYDEFGNRMTKGIPESKPAIPVSPDHRMRFVVAMGVASLCTVAACAFPPAAGGAVTGYIAAINEARQIPELNHPASS